MPFYVIADITCVIFTSCSDRGSATDGDSALAVLWLSATGMNSIVIVGGANQRLSVSDVAAADGLISSARVLLCQLEVPLETTLAALRAAGAHGGQSASSSISRHLAPALMTSAIMALELSIGNN